MGSLPERACLLTFDDGLRCQIEHALPVLERLAVPAVFFVPGLPLADGGALTVHKLHHVRETLTDDQLAAELEHAGVSLDDAAEEAARAHYRYDTPSSARIKYLLNMVLPFERREAVVESVFGRIHCDEREFSTGLYMTADIVAGLERSHRAIGAHSYGHRPLAHLTPRVRQQDLRRCAVVLERVTGTRPPAFSYPHGTDTTVDIASARDVAAAGFSVAFTMERALNTSLAEPCLLARFDTNDAPGGRRPLLEVRDGALRMRAGATAGRRRYVDEAGEKA